MEPQQTRSNPSMGYHDASNGWSADEAERSSPLITVLINIFVVCILSSLLILAYHHFYVSKTMPPRIVSLDLPEIIEIKQLQTSLTLLQGGAGEQNAVSVYNEVTAFGKTLETEVRRMQDDCDCILVVRAAVVGGNRTDDYTDVMKDRMGLSGITKESLTRELEMLGRNLNDQLSSLGSASPAPPFQSTIPPNLDFMLQQGAGQKR